MKAAVGRSFVQYIHKGQCLGRGFLFTDPDKVVIERDARVFDNGLDSFSKSFYAQKILTSLTRPGRCVFLVGTI
jgi:hypothetical protein